MSHRSRVHPPRLSRKRVLLTGIILLVVVIVGVDVVSRILFAPWSIGVFGRDTLTGSWVGTLRAQQGAEYGLSLDLGYKGRDGGGYRGSALGSTNLTGHAIICSPTGERFKYDVSGDASRSGVIEDLWLEYGDPSLSALKLRLSGRWRAPSLTLEPNANPFLPDGSFSPTRVFSSDDPDDAIAPFDLDKEDPAAFEAMCHRLQSSGAGVLHLDTGNGTSVYQEFVSGRGVVSEVSPARSLVAGGTHLGLAVWH
jgi:hypothetical protein